MSRQQTVLDFRSDNVGTAAPEMLAALHAVNVGPVSSYGADDLSAMVHQRYSELFETDVEVFAVPTGTAANATCLATLSPPWGAIFCHVTAHAHTSECAATEFFSGGAKLCPVSGNHGRISPAAFQDALFAAGAGLAHRPQPAVLTLTQATEWGTLYDIELFDTLCGHAREHGLRIHLDGSRFANAVAALALPPADLTWRRGVDMLSFGLTKNGGLMCDAIVSFRPEFSKQLRYRLRKSGYGWSKMRFASAQLIAYIADGLWLRSAHHANSMASKLAHGLRSIDGLRIVAPVEANELFLELPPRLLRLILESDVLVHPINGGLLRMVCRGDTSESEVAQCIATLRLLVSADATESSSMETVSEANKQ
jgi:threonine aldolase